MTDLQAGIVAAVAVLVVILLWHAIVRDKEVRRTRWGVFIERDRYVEDEGEKWTVEPLPPTPPPPPASDEQVTQEYWPEKKD